VGRRQHLEALEEAFQATQQGRAEAVFVHGRSGAGKTALVQHFLEEIGRGGQAVVLAGRCYEQESVPYKALDSLIDALSHYLRRLPPPEAQALLPRDVLQLARLFPVLRRVEAVARAPARSFETPDSQELRRRAFAALRDLLGRLGERRPLVLAIDDLQWGDVDSATLLAELLRPPDPPALLLLACYRSEDVGRSPCLSFLLQPSKETGAAERRPLAVETLLPGEAQELALQLLPADDSASRAWAEAIARESGGSPFFVHELALAARAGTRASDRAISPGPKGLDQVLWDRVQGLPAEARRLLEVVAVSGRPVGRAEACRAAGLVGDERAALAVLRSGRLIRSTGPIEGEEIETYHDRIRETVVAHLPPPVLREHHRRLAQMLKEASDRVDPEVLAVHFEGAQEPEQASTYFALAAAKAAEALAFDQAARLYRHALCHPPAAPAEVRNFRIKLGDALANAGRGAEAGEAYLAAVQDEPVNDSLEERQRAAMQYMISGHIDVGLATFLTVLKGMGMEMPRSPRWALVVLLLRRLQLWFRGLGFRRRDASQVPAEDLRRIDVCWSAVAGLSLVDPIRAMYFHTRSLLLALRAGEPYRIARELAMEGLQVSTAGGPARARTAKILAVATELAQQVNHPYALGMVCMNKGFAAYLEGRWQTALELCDQAEGIFNDHCTGVAWELDMAHTFALWSLTYMGEVAELTRRRQVLLQQARVRGDRFAVTILTIMETARLGADDPEGARQELHQVMSEWSQQGFHVQHHAAILARVYIGLYSGDGAATYAYVSEQWPAYKGSLLSRVQHIRIDFLQSRARSALAASIIADNPKPFLRAAGRDAKRLEREKVGWSAALARLVRAGIAGARGDTIRAVRLLREAATQFDEVDMLLFAAAARRRTGELLGGEEGRGLIEGADAWMAGQGIVNPARMTAMLAPGFPD
jgi:tetratricopeptide (TPR) repeat protein